MFSLEELTKEELIEWIRKNNPKIDEVEIVRQTLFQRSKYISEQCSKFFELQREAEPKAMEIIKPYIPAGAKTGTKIYNVPADIIQQFNELKKEYEALWTEYKAWSNLSAETSTKIAELTEYMMKQKWIQTHGGD